MKKIIELQSEMTGGLYSSIIRVIKLMVIGLELEDKEYYEAFLSCVRKRGYIGCFGRNEIIRYFLNTMTPKRFFNSFQKKQLLELGMTRKQYNELEQFAMMEA